MCWVAYIMTTLTIFKWASYTRNIMHYAEFWMLIDTMFARDLYQVYKINDDWWLHSIREIDWHNIVLNIHEARCWVNKFRFFFKFEMPLITISSAIPDWRWFPLVDTESLHSWIVQVTATGSFHQLTWKKCKINVLFFFKAGAFSVASNIDF